MENTVNTAPAQPTPEATAQPPQKVRRVGTFAFGLVLIAAGALMLAAVLVPGFDPRGVVRFAPVILIVLGIEVLVYASRPGVKLRYDFLSMLACAFILAAVGGASIIPYVWEHLGPEAELRREQLAVDLELAAYDSIRADKTLENVVRDANITIYSGELYSKNVQSIEDLSGSQTYARFTLAPRYDTAEAFAADCRKIVAACEGLPIWEFYFRTEQQEEGDDICCEYDLTMAGPWLHGTDAAILADSVNTHWYYQDSYFGSREAIEAYIAEREDRDAEYDGEDASYSAGYEQGYRDALEGVEAPVAMEVPAPEQAEAAGSNEPMPAPEAGITPEKAE